MLIRFFLVGIFWLFLPHLLNAENAGIWSITDYKIQGTGEANILILPCMSCRWRSFDTFMERNKDRYTMYAITVPGFGGSKVPELPMWSDQPVWQENALLAVEEFITEHEINDAVVLTHSWGSILAAQLLARQDDFAQSWIILDTYVPFDPGDQALPYEDKLKLVQNWRTENMEPLRSPDAWAQFNKPAPYASPERQILYHGMFMATPRDVLFQYWRENGLRRINEDFGKISIPVVEVKSISATQTDPEEAKDQYVARYQSVPHPYQLRTVFISKAGHHQIEHRPEIIDDIIRRVVEGEPIEDYDPSGQD